MSILNWRFVSHVMFFSCNYGLALFFDFVKSDQANSLIFSHTACHSQTPFTSFSLLVDCFFNFLISSLSFSPNWLTVFFIFQFMACIFDFSHIMISTNKKHPPERLNPKIHLPKKVLFTNKELLFRYFFILKILLLYYFVRLQNV